MNEIDTCINIEKYAAGGWPNPPQLLSFFAHTFDRVFHILYTIDFLTKCYGMWNV